MAQTFAVLEADTAQPVCFTTETSARTVSQATPALLELAHAMLQPESSGVLVLADAEHFTQELLTQVHQTTQFDLLVPMPMQPAVRKHLALLPPECFMRRWAGFATATLPFQLPHAHTNPFVQFVQRLGEHPDEWTFKAFLATADDDEADALTRDYPTRWHIEIVRSVDLKALHPDYDYAWPNSKDHAKWAVSREGNWVCVADINLESFIRYFTRLLSGRVLVTQAWTNEERSWESMTSRRMGACRAAA